MSSISSNSTYNGFHIIGQNYYDFAPLAGSTLNQNPSLSHLMRGPGANALNTSLWQNLMTTQQNLFAGWNSFCGCPSARPQPKTPCKDAASGCNRKPVDIHIHHHFYKNSCGGPFTAQGGQGSSSVGQNYNAFGSRSGCSNWSNLCNMPCYSPFSGNGFNFGGYGQYGGGSVYSNMLSQAGFPNYPSFDRGAAAFHQGYSLGGNSFGGLSAPSIGFGNFGSSYFNGGVGAFGLPGSAYGDFSFGSAFGYGTSIGSMNTMTLLNGALSLLF